MPPSGLPSKDVYKGVPQGEVLAALQRGGFTLTHVRGSHHYLRKSGTGLVVVPVHGIAPCPPVHFIRFFAKLA
ncbi:MAG TPA: type II toxin-antitoxin system HicA family toxin [Thermoanaerobaculia bacterium]|nr:type II toxin-antitoxin system HicA family toxin [Thermoanaerobaculia bacterium]